MSRKMILQASATRDQEGRGREEELGRMEGGAGRERWIEERKRGMDGEHGVPWEGKDPRRGSAQSLWKIPVRSLKVMATGDQHVATKTSVPWSGSHSGPCPRTRAPSGRLTTAHLPRPAGLRQGPPRPTPPGSQHKWALAVGRGGVSGPQSSRHRINYCALFRACALPSISGSRRPLPQPGASATETFSFLF